MQEGLKIIKTEIENFQSLELKEVNIDGKSIAVVGKNEGSKSAFIRAMMSALNSEFIPEKALKEGEEKGSVKVVVSGSVEGEEKTYTYQVFFDKNRQKGKFKVVDEEGMEIDKRSVQKSIVGDISFDPFDFIRLGKTESGDVSKPGVRKQVEFLKGFLSVDEIKELNRIDRESQEAYDDRTAQNKLTKQYKLELESMDIDVEDSKKYAKDRSEELSKKREEQKSIYEKISKHKSVQEAIDHRNKEIERLKKEIEAHESHIENAKKWLKEHPKPSEDKLDKEIEELEEYQKVYNSISEVRSVNKRYKESSEKSKELTDKLDALKAKKASIFANADLPINGLEFTEDSVTYKGMPFDEDHHPKSTIIGVGVAIGMKLNPKLRCIFIKDGSLLDKDTYKKILSMCNKKGYQLIIEMVDWNGSDMEIKFSEELI